MMTEKGQYYRDSRKYLNSIMRAAKQEDLMLALAKLEYHELKYCIASGVPGHAMHAANEILAIRKDELRKFEVEQVGKIEVEYEDKTVEGDEKDELEAVRTPESG